MDNEKLEWLSENLDCIAKNLADASGSLVDMKPTDDGYDAQARVVDRLVNDYQVLLKQYYEIVHPETEDKPRMKWYERLDVTRIITTSAIIVASLGQSFAIYKWQRDGYLIGRDAAKIQMPRP